jgi:hypothetical protein
VTALAICSTLIGSVLGIRFRFIVLLPLVFLGSVGLVTFSIEEGESFLQALSAIAVFASLLQLGYVCSAFLRHAATPAHAAGRWSLLGSPNLLRKTQALARPALAGAATELSFPLLCCMPDGKCGARRRLPEVEIAPGDPGADLRRARRCI